MFGRRLRPGGKSVEASSSGCQSHIGLLQVSPAARAQSPLQKLFAPIHAFIMHITASFFLAKTVIGVMMNQVNMLATTEQQARRIGESLLGIQTAVQRQMQQGSSVFLVNAALAMIASVLRSGAVAQKSAKQGSAQHRLTLHQALPCFSQLEEYTLARYAPHLLHRLIPFSAGTLKRSHAQQSRLMRQCLFRHCDIPRHDSC